MQTSTPQSYASPKAEAYQHAGSTAVTPRQDEDWVDQPGTKSVMTAQMWRKCSFDKLFDKLSDRLSDR
jgi:hypothetical protein